MRFFIIILLSSSLFSQTKIDFEHIDFKLLEDMVLEKVNEERASKGLSILTDHKVLKSAAINHSAYQAKKRRMTHSQTSKKSKTPLDRVKNAGGGFTLVGENVAYTDAFGKIILKVSRKKKEFATNTYQDIVDIFFIGWKNSKVHYKAIMNKSYTHSGISFAYDKKNKRFYGTQIFGMK